MIQNPIYFWEKSVLKQEDENKDKLNFYIIAEDPSIREVIRNLESKIIEKEILFTEISPKISVTKKWINDIRNSYPEQKNDIVENLLDTFRGSLYPRSKERYRLIVGLLLLRDTILLVHCKKDPSLAEMKDNIYSVNLILHPKNVLRAAIIKNEDGKTTFSAFEFSRKWSKGHAEFWGIDPEDVSWESLGNIVLIIEFESFSLPVQLAIETENLDEMIKNNDITTTGKIKIGREEGKIIGVKVFRKSMDFSEFYDFYITHKEKLAEFRKKFVEIISPHILNAYDKDINNLYRYVEDERKIYEITTEDNKAIYDKIHPRFTICFFTNDYPKIKPNLNFLYKLYQSIFQNHTLDIWHAGIESSRDPVILGNLNIYNKIEFNQEFNEFSTNFLNIIQDAASIKKRLLLQVHYCNFWKRNMTNRHFKVLFDYIIETILVRDLKFEFNNEGLFDKEEHLEFKSSDAVNFKPSRFASETLIPTIKKYSENGRLTRLCILYGIEDNGKIKPLYNFGNDQINNLEEIVNRELLNEKIQTIIQPIPFREGIILSVFLIPLI